MLNLSLPKMLWVGMLAAGLLGGRGAAAPSVDFNRDVRPILSDNCFTCHGPDKNTREADLRLDTKEGLFRTQDNVTTLVPGKPEHSEVYRRITSDDRGDLMPPPKSGKKLTDGQKELIKRWIEQGAQWKGHWAYIAPTRGGVPAAADPVFARNAVDHFVLQKQREAGLKPAAQADRVTLLRRLSLDLTGLPPTVEEVSAFLSDQSPNAYERQVDRLLASRHYGERMAVFWLDLVRYADTIGYHSDNPRNISPYRDYVIAAFNANMPLDQFTVEQIAGDLLPDATLWQKVGSAYNRLLQTTEEGGAQPKEYAAKYLSDRVRNLSVAWLGVTMGCAECHDHKFDPITAKDFYAMEAFFTDLNEAPVGRREKGMAVPSGEQARELAELDGNITALKRKLETPTPELAAAQEQWEKQFGSGDSAVEWQMVQPETASSKSGAAIKKQADATLLVTGTIPNMDTYTVTFRPDLKQITGIRLEVLDDPSFPAGGPGLSENGNFVLTEVKLAGDAPVNLHRASADHSQEAFPVAHVLDNKKETGWAVLPQTGRAHTAIFEATAPVSADTLTLRLGFDSQYPKHQFGKFRVSVTSHPNPAGVQALPATVRVALLAGAGRTDPQNAELAAYYRTIAPLLQPVRDELAAVEKRKEKLLESVPHVLLSVSSGKPRPARLLPRGNYLDDSGPLVPAAFPAFLSYGQGTANGQLTRLDLAKWLVDRNNPLTARVFANRAWRLFFGQGLSRSVDDFGAQGEWPTHPELLDYLAVDFMESGWDVKRLVRLMVTSGTYRQSSVPDRLAREKDPDNLLLTRQARFRLDAEFVRDNALAVSGLLNTTVGGESVKPYQPAGYWDYLNFPKRTYAHDAGDKQYRRGLYTHWQRTFLHPSLRAFDAPTREECEAQRPRSNIPQQALVLLNDPTYVEAARVFAEKVLRSAPGTTEQRIAWAFERALSRKPKTVEAQVLRNLFESHHKAYTADLGAAQALLKTGLAPVPADLNAADLAAWTGVTRAILNLHETITRN